MIILFIYTLFLFYKYLKLKNDFSDLKQKYYNKRLEASKWETKYRELEKRC